MKIKLKVNRQTRSGIVKAGTVINLPEQAARDLIALNQAIPADKEKEK